MDAPGFGCSGSLDVIIGFPGTVPWRAGVRCAPVADAQFVCAPVSCSAVSWWVCRVRDILGKGLKLEDPGCKGFTEDLQRTKTFLLSCDINLGHQDLRTCSALSNCKTQSPNLKSEEEGQPVGSDVLTDE